jgi:hypothetical protein
MKRYTIESVRYPGRQAQEKDISIILKRAGHHWPDEGMEPRIVRGIETPKPGETNIAIVEIKVWVSPRGQFTGRKSSKHRVFCECPGCKKTLSVGRLHQHVCKG